MINYYEEGSIELIGKIIGERNYILFVTATDTETNHLHKYIEPIPKQSAIIRYYKGDLTFYIGKLGNYVIIHVQTEMGSISRSSSIMTINESLAIFKPKIVIMVGIAFGVDENKQNIGDVLISESISPYNYRRVGKNEIIQRASDAPCNKTLLNRFKNLRTWEHILPTGEKAKLIFANIISGEELIDDIEYRDNLLKNFPTALGGEMEGAGLYSACDNKAAWIIVKGICDFADGNKLDGKKEKQGIAIESSVSVCIELLSQRTVFDEFEVYSLKNEFYNNRPSIKLDNSLFEIYDKDYENYYVQRNYDMIFDEYLNSYSVWIHGKTGLGKTCIIQRNTIIKNKTYLIVNLSLCIGQPVESFFREIYFEIIQYLNIEDANNVFNDFMEINKAIIHVLVDNFANSELYIHIDEIPLNEGADFGEFFTKFYSLLTVVNSKNVLKGVKFLFSSIVNPFPFIKDQYQKIYIVMKFLQLSNWLAEDINRLIEVISKDVNIVIDEEISNELYLYSKGSPRFVKKFFKNALLLTELNNQNLRIILEETKVELGF